jgi:hypothetical protein
MNNNPVRYRDPSGHAPAQVETSEPQDCELFSCRYGVIFTGAWWDDENAYENLMAATEAVKAVGQKLAEILGGTAADAFRAVYGYMDLHWGDCSDCAEDGDVGGFTVSAHEIRFKGMSDISDLRRTNHVVHELGHAFRKALYDKTTIDTYDKLTKWRQNHSGYPDRETFTGPEGTTGPNVGFASPQNQFTWQQSLDGSDNEEFADQFLGWTFNMWETNENGRLTTDGQARSDMMNSNMPLWVDLAAGQ